MLISTIQNVTWPNYSKALYGINNRNEMQTHQGMDSRHLKKSTVLTKKYWENTLLSINFVIDDRLTINVNKVYMYMSFVVSLY